MQEAKIKIKIDTKEAQKELKSLGGDVDRIEKDARSRVGKVTGKRAAGRGGIAPAARGGKGRGIGGAVGTAVTMRGAFLLAGETANLITTLTPFIKGIITSQTEGSFKMLGEMINKIIGLPANVIDFTKGEAGGRLSGAMQGLEAVKALAEMGVDVSPDELGTMGKMFRDSAVAQTRFDQMIEKQKKEMTVSKYETKDLLKILIGEEGFSDLQKTIRDEIMSVIKGGTGLIPGR